MNECWAAVVKCPYYAYSDKNRISCTGFLGKGTYCQTTFPNKEARMDHMENFCAYYPNGCPIFLENEERLEIERA